MQKLFLILSFLFLGLCAKAQWCFVPADGIVTWDRDVVNLRNTALQASQQLRPHPISASLTQLKELEEAWIKASKKAPAEEQSFSAVNRFNLSAQLLSLTADSRYALDMEQLIYGPLLQCATTPQMSAEKVVCAQTLLNALGTVLATKGDSLYVNFYTNSTALIASNGEEMQLDIITGMPFHERVKIRFTRMTSTQGVKQTICIRLPQGVWNDKTLPIYCNGHDTPYKVENGYAIITNTWRPGFEIYFDLPQPLLELR